MYFERCRYVEKHRYSTPSPLRYNSERELYTVRVHGPTLAHLQHVSIVIDMREFQQADNDDEQKYNESPQFVVCLHFFVLGHFLNIYLPTRDFGFNIRSTQT